MPFNLNKKNKIKKLVGAPVKVGFLKQKLQNKNHLKNAKYLGPKTKDSHILK